MKTVDLSAVSVAYVSHPWLFPYVSSLLKEGGEARGWVYDKGRSGPITRISPTSAPVAILTDHELARQTEGKTKDDIVLVGLWDSNGDTIESARASSNEGISALRKDRGDDLLAHELVQLMYSALATEVRS